MKEYYTIGEMAKLAGVSYKTIRYYVEKGLLVPKDKTEGGYYLFHADVVEKLQRISMLKYLNFSLEEIKQMLEGEDSSETFSKQEELLMAEKEHLEQVIQAVRQIQKIPKEEQWEQMVQIIQLTSQKEEIQKQYKTSGNLQSRINIHTYSTSKVDWFDWIYERLELKPGMKILEIGCGNGYLWTAICKKLPEHLEIYLIDNSEGMLKEAKKRIEERKKVFEEKNIKFIFQQKDAENFSMDTGHFDRIIANHMLYHVSNTKRPELLRICGQLLKPEGMFMASTVGRTHLKQLFALMEQFDKRIKIAHWLTENFELENGKEQLERFFSNIVMEEQQNDLLVPDWMAIYEYALSLPGNGKQIIKERDQEFKKYLKNRISDEKPLYIHKSTGVFRGYKSHI